MYQVKVSLTNGVSLFLTEGDRLTSKLNALSHPRRRDAFATGLRYSEQTGRECEVVRA